jgi:hypothetical protein
VPRKKVWVFKKTFSESQSSRTHPIFSLWVLPGAALTHFQQVRIRKQRGGGKGPETL